MEASLEYDWFYDALRYSIRATSSTSSGGRDFDDRDPRFQNLEGVILYSRRLLLTYNAIVIVLIALLAVGHWFDRGRILTPCSPLRCQSQSRQAIQVGNGVTFNSKIGDESSRQVEEASSSGSSTLEGTESPLVFVKTADEDTPLLHDGQLLKPHDLRKSLMGSIKAALMYQPSPVPFINKTLPSNGCSISIMAFIGLNIFYTVFNIKYDKFLVFTLADRCGLVFVANLPLLYLLAAKTQPIKLLTGYSYESLNIIHRRLGELLCFEAFLHFIGMTATWYIFLRPGGLDLWQFITHRIILLGLLAFVAYELLYFTSLGSFRQRCYELFLALHVSLQSTALVLLFFHHSQSRAYVGIALGIFLIDRLVYRFGLKSLTTSGTIQVMEDGETVLVSALIPQKKPTLPRRLFGKSVLNGWQASDHVFITIPSLGRSFTVQAHPFTIISPAPPSPERSTPSDPATLSLLIRSQSGFSSSILQYALQHTSLTLRLDGPYGAHHARNILASSSLAILIAGGSGIAVAWPLLNSLVSARDPETHPDEPSPFQLVPCKQKIILIWIVHSRLHESWLPKEAMEELQTAAAAAASSKSRGTSNRPVEMEIEVIIPLPTEEVGRPDLRALMRDLVASNRPMGNGETRRRNASGRGGDMDRDVAVDCEKQKYRVGVVASGPDGLAREARNTVAGLVRQGWDVGIQIEKFGW